MAERTACEENYSLQEILLSQISFGTARYVLEERQLLEM
jgi:hypothetical protein